MRNLELKARVADLKRIRNIAANLGATPAGKDRQVDTYYNSPRGRLKIRESAMTGNELIAYFRPDDPGTRESEYERIRIGDLVKFKRMLDWIMGQKAVVVKDREIFLLGATRIHLDEVENLGCFVELECVYNMNNGESTDKPEDVVNELIGAFGIKSDDLVGCSYGDLLLKRQGGN